MVKRIFNNRGIFLSFLILFFGFQLISANFVCGNVNDAPDLSASWSKIIVYYDGYEQFPINCEINPENKFCCDLSEITLVEWTTGKKVFGEIFDESTGYISKKEFLITNEEGYQIFPNFTLEKAISINGEIPKIVLNKSVIFFNITISENYPNLKYELKNEQGDFLGEICQNCTEASFSVNISEGKNEIKFIAYNLREINSTLEIYNLKYLNFERELTCEYCIKKNNQWYVLGGQNTSMKITLNSSHEIEKEIIEYIPSGWIVSEEIINLTSTHNSLKWNSKDGNTFEYFTISPDKFPSSYEFVSSVGGINQTDKVNVIWSRWWPKFIKSKHKGNYQDYYFGKKNCQTTPSKPIVLIPENSFFDSVIIYPNEEWKNVIAYVENEKYSRGRIEKLRIYSNLENDKIESIVIKFKTEKGKTISLSKNGELLEYEKYKSDEIYDYYQSEIDELGEILLSIN